MSESGISHKKIKKTEANTIVADINVTKLFLILLQPLEKKKRQHVSGRKEGNVLFNNILNTFYLRLYGYTDTYGKVPLR